MYFLCDVFQLRIGQKGIANYHILLYSVSTFLTLGLLTSACYFSENDRVWYTKTLSQSFWIRSQTQCHWFGCSQDVPH